MTYRIILWGPGEVGGNALRAALARPEFEVVGAKVFSSHKDGVDIGVLAGGEPIGVAATTDADALVALEADCVIHTPMLPFDISVSDLEVIRLLESGKNVVSAVSYTEPAFFGTGYVARLEKACEAGGVSLHGSGAYPGFVERWVVGMSAAIPAVRHVSLTEYCDGIKALSPMVLEFAGFGEDPEKVAAGSAVTAVQDRFYFQSVAYIGRRLFGLGRDDIRIETTYRGIPAEERFVASPELTIEPGQTLSLHNTYVGYSGDQPFFTGNWHWYLGKENRPNADIISGSQYCVELDGGFPSISARFDVVTEDDDPVAPTTHLTAIPLLMAVVPTCAAPPGIVSLDSPMFAAPDLTVLAQSIT